MLRYVAHPSDIFCVVLGQRRNLRLWSEVPSDLDGAIEDIPCPMAKYQWRFAVRPPGARRCGGAGLLRARARRAFDVGQPKRDLQSAIPPKCLGAGRKGDTELSVRLIAYVASLVAALEGPTPEGMYMWEWERVLQAVPPGKLMINFAASAVLAHAVPRPHRYAPPSRERLWTSPSSLPKASRRLLWM